MKKIKQFARDHQSELIVGGMFFVSTAMLISGGYLAGYTHAKDRWQIMNIDVYKNTNDTKRALKIEHKNGKITILRFIQA